MDARYPQALRTPGVAPMLLAGLAVRAPWGAALVVLVLHVVTDLGRGYAMAGLVVSVLGITTAIAGPWRGRLLDRVGLRRTLGPSLLMLAVTGSAAAWVGYWPLLAVCALLGMYAVPALAVVRSALDASVGERLRPTVMALDAVVADAAYLLGPASGVALAARLGDRAALTVCFGVAACGGLLLWLLNPARRVVGGHVERGRGVPGGVGLIVVVSLAFACAVLDTAGELATVAAMTDWRRPELIGLVISTWAVGSILGGLLYGALPARPGGAVLLMALAGTIALTAAASSPAAFALLLGLNGLFVAPTYAAISTELVAVAPRERHSEALGWQSGAMMLGGALGTPAAGLVIDRWSWGAGLLVPAAVAALLAVLCVVIGSASSRDQDASLERAH